MPCPDAGCQPHATATARRARRDRQVLSYPAARLLNMVLIGAHVDWADPLSEAAARDADVVQFFLSDPQGWKKPEPRSDADRIRAAGVAVYIHAPYRINVATTNN